MSLGMDFEVSKAQTRPNSSLSVACGSRCRILSFFFSIISASVLPCSLAMMVMD